MKYLSIRSQEKFFSKKALLYFIILCTFALQSRVFLSQLLFTGDESGFFYAFLFGNFVIGGLRFPDDFLEDGDGGLYRLDVEEAE